MKKLPYQIKALAYVLLYVLLTCSAYWIGDTIKDYSFAFGMIQITLTTILLIFCYPILAKEGKKLGTHIASNFLYGLMCVGLFAIASLSAYLHVLGSTPPIEIAGNLPPLMLVFLVVTTLFCYTMNEAILISLLQGVVKGENSTKAMVVFATYVIAKVGIAAYMSPNSLLVMAIQIVVIGSSATILLAAKKSILLLPIAATLVGILFVAIT